jgi:hypothetical protein
MSVAWIVPAPIVPAAVDGEGAWRLEPTPVAARAFVRMVEELRSPGIWGALWQREPGTAGRLVALFRTRPRFPGLAEAALSGWGLPAEPIGRLRRLGERALALDPLLEAELGRAHARALLVRLCDGEPVRLDGPLAPLRRRLGQELAAIAGTGGGIRTPDHDGVSVALYP